MRRPVVALVVAAVALSLTGCGGGDAATAPPAAAPAAAAPAPAAPAPTPVSTTNKLSPSEPGTGTPFPASGPSVPDGIVRNLANHVPMLVFFYDPGQPTTADQKAEIDAAMREYRGLITLVELDVTAALPDEVTKKSGGKLAEQTALLVQELKVGFTPYTILVDKNGMMTGRYRGFVDRGLLDREILKATQ